MRYDSLRGEFVLWYTGMRYDFTPPSGAAPFTNRTRYKLAWQSKRVGVATASSPHGPWRRSDAPVLHPRPGECSGAEPGAITSVHTGSGGVSSCWDGSIVSNPSPLLRADGSVLLVYKSKTPSGIFHLGLAGAPAPRGPYSRLLGGTPLLLRGASAAGARGRRLQGSGGARGGSTVPSSGGGIEWLQRIYDGSLGHTLHQRRGGRARRAVTRHGRAHDGTAPIVAEDPFLWECGGIFFLMLKCMAPIPALGVKAGMLLLLQSGNLAVWTATAQVRPEAHRKCAPSFCYSYHPPIKVPLGVFQPVPVWNAQCISFGPRSGAAYMMRFAEGCLCSFGICNRSASLGAWFQNPNFLLRPLLCR